MMNPAVRLECEDCGWSLDVPPEHIRTLPNGVPCCDEWPFHRCPDGRTGTLFERASWDVELVTIAPMHNFVLKLK